MESFFYNNPVEVFFGTDSVLELAQHLKKQKKKNIMLVYGKNSIKAFGIYNKIVETLKDFNLVDFGGVADPEYKYVQEGIKIAKSKDVDTVIGIGGCTCMDIAKMIAFGAKHEDIEDYLRLEKTPNGDALTIVTIPTYPSGGSEVDDASEIDNLTGGIHGSLYGVYPNMTCLNPEFSYSLDSQYTAYAGIVTFIQASINYLGGKSEIAEGLTRTILDTVLSSLEKSIEEPTNFEARGNQMWASAMTTMGVLSCGKDMSWPSLIYEEIEYCRRLMPLSFRQALTIFFPRWLLSRVKYHKENIKKYVCDNLGVSTELSAEKAAEVGAKNFIKLLEKYNLPAYFDDVVKIIPTDEQIQSDIDANPSDELKDDDVFKMIKSCFRNK